MGDRLVVAARLDYRPGVDFEKTRKSNQGVRGERRKGQSRMSEVLDSPVVHPYEKACPQCEIQPPVPFCAVI